MSDEILIIPTDQSHGGSGFGLSHYGPWDTCPRKSRLDDAFPIIGGDRINGATVGDYFHQIMEHYYPKGLEGVALRFDGAQQDVNWAEALRLFREYRKHFPADEFGERVYAEESFILAYDPDSGPAFDLDEYDYGYIDLDVGDKYGVPVYSGRFDLRMYLDQEHCDRLNEARGLDLPLTPGWWLVDHKTMAQKKSNVIQTFMESEQFIGYQMACEDLGMPVEGVLVNCIIRSDTKAARKAQEKDGEEVTGLTKDKFFSIVVPPPTQRQREIFRSNMARRWWLQNNWPGEDYCNTSACHSMYGTCRHLTSGACDRICK